MDDPLFSPAFFWMWNAPLDAAALCAQLPFDKHNHESGLYGPVCVFAIGNGTTGDKTN